MRRVDKSKSLSLENKFYDVAIKSDATWSSKAIYPTTVPYPSTGGVVVSPTATTASYKDINWKEYTPARPPISGDYLVTVINGVTKTRQVLRLTFDYPTLSWGCSDIVTHYAKIELP